MCDTMFTILLLRCQKKAIVNSEGVLSSVSLSLSLSHSLSLSLYSSTKSSSEEPAQVGMDHVVWKGFVNMSGLSKFATTAYPVAGPVQELDTVKGDHKLPG